MYYKWIIIHSWHEWPNISPSLPKTDQFTIILIAIIVIGSYTSFALSTIVHFILVCQRLFGDDFFLLLLIFSWNLHEAYERFLCVSETNVQLDTTKDNEIPHIPPL